jgi:hypothetical protein
MSFCATQKQAQAQARRRDSKREWVAYCVYIQCMHAWVYMCHSGKPAIATVFVHGSLLQPPVVGRHSCLRRALGIGRHSTVLPSGKLQILPCDTCVIGLCPHLQLNQEAALVGVLQHVLWHMAVIEGFARVLRLYSSWTQAVPGAPAVSPCRSPLHGRSRVSMLQRQLQALLSIPGGTQVLPDCVVRSRRTGTILSAPAPASRCKLLWLSTVSKPADQLDVNPCLMQTTPYACVSARPSAM